MSWCSIREYSEKTGQAASTIRRNVQRGRLYGRKFGRSWYVFEEDERSEPMTSAVAASSFDFPETASGQTPSSLQGLLDFSSKALHHYLMMHDKLMAEKDLRLKEKENALKQRNIEVSELEGYVRILENALTREREKGSR